MRGQIKEKSKGVYLIRIETRKNGKRETLFSRTLRGNKTDANKLLTEKLAELDKGFLVKDSKQTLNEYLGIWLESIAKPRLHSRTFGDYKDIVRLYLSDSLGNIKLGELKAFHIQKLYGDMQEGGLGPRRIRYAHSVLSSALKKAVQLDILPRNVASLVQLPKQTRREMDTLTKEECGMFLKAAEGERLSALFSFAIATGTRPEEYLALQWKDVDLEKGTAIIRRALITNRTGGGWYFNEPKTKQSRRTIPLPVSVLKELKAYRRRQGEERLKLGSAWSDFDLVFPSEVGTPLNPSRCTKVLKRVLIKAGIRTFMKDGKINSSFRLYDLRHTCATLLLSAGINPKVVSERLGHATITLTLDVYSHVLPNMQKDATNQLEKMIFSN
jgi:integrase